MKKIFFNLLLAIMALSSAALYARSPLMDLPLVDSIKVGDFTIPKTGTKKDIMLPKLPPRPGYVVVLRCRMVTYQKNFGGGAYAAKLSVSGTDLLSQTAAGDPRMLGKHPVWELRSSFKGTQFDYWSANDARLDMPYGPSCDVVDADSVNGDASVYLLDLSDVLSSNDSNTLTFHNIRRYRKGFDESLLVNDCEIGYLSRKVIPPRPTSQIAYEPLQIKRTRGDYTLEVGKFGGFVYTDNTNNNQLIVESRIGMDFSSPNTVVASDKRVPKVPVQVKNIDFGIYGAMTEITFPNQIKLIRKLKIGEDGLLQWQEEWKNLSNKIAGIPFHHRMSFNSQDPRIWLSGEPEASFIPTPASNPTVVLEERNGIKRGFGLTLESDITRMVCSTKNIGDTAEVYTATLALAPGKSQRMEFSIDPIRQDGYWTFINRLRERWDLNSYTAQRPLFLGLLPKTLPKENREEYLKKIFAHQGKIYIAMKPWRSGEEYIIRNGDYPKLPADAPRCVGGTPDLDIEKYLTFKHRDLINNDQKKNLEMLHRILPNAKIIQICHPSMEAIYLPLQERWPWMDCAIRDKKGEIYHLPHYDESHLKKYSGKGGWIIGYFVPYGGSKYYEKLLENFQKGIEIGFDGCYVDEFSFVFERAGYSRYTYDRWDGFSADLDKNGNVVQLKSDNAYSTINFQHAAVDLMNRQGKHFHGNLMAATRSVNNAPFMRFWEAQARVGWEHVDKVPAILGHIRGDLAKTFDGARQAVNFGCIYSPFADSAPILPPDNFVIKQHPLTVQKIFHGGIIGKERIITVKSGEYEWKGVPDGTEVELFIYNKSGVQINKGRKTKVVNGKINLRVPRDGMVIAERPGVIQK